jgi:hypothetical protein
MTKSQNLTGTKTLLNEKIKSVRGGLILNRNSLSTRPTSKNRFGSHGIIGMNGVIGMNVFGSFGILRMNG